MNIRNYNIFFLWFLLPLIACNQIRAEDTSLEQLIDAHTHFAFCLYPHLNAEQSNLIFSPYSISSCLSMAYLGSREKTQEEMQRTLKCSLPLKEIAASYSALNQGLLPTASKKSYELNIANALWLDQSSYILTQYRYMIEKQFSAKIANVLFSKPQEALMTINNWVAEQTKGQIQNLLTRNDITASTRMLLTNAVYFKGSFTLPFDAKKTHEAIFYPTTASYSSVKMMDQTAFFPYAENELFQAIALTFSGSTQARGQLALVLCLPKSADNFDLLIESMPDAFKETLSHLHAQKIHLQLPKFSLSKRYGLNEALQQMGMENPFTTQANFSGIDGMLNLYISQVAHETYFSLDENGVAAAAATAAAMNVTAAPSEDPPAEFLADHPFYSSSSI